MKVIGYVRVSTEGQAERGASLSAQKQAIQAECERRGWTLCDLASDNVSAETVRKRIGLQRALEALDRGDYDALLVARMDRAFRSVGDFAVTLDRANRKGWALRMLDPDVDMTTPYGRALAGVAAVFAQLERELITQRIRDGIAEKKRQGTYRGGRATPQGRPLDGPALARIRSLHTEGLGLQAIARQLELEGVPTAKGGRWTATTVRRVLLRDAEPDSAAAAH